MTFDFSQTLTLLTAVIGLITAGLLLILPSAKRENRLLSLFLVLFSYHLFSIAAIPTGMISGRFYLSPVIMFLYGPLLFLYVKALLKQRVAPKDLFHGSGALAALLIYYSNLFEIRLLFWFFCLQLLGYLLATFRQLRKVTVKPGPKAWIQFLVVSFGLIWLTSLAEGLYFLFNQVETANAPLSLSFILMLIYLAGILYFSMAHTSIFIHAKVLISNQNRSVVKGHEGDDQMAINKVLHAMEQEKLYRKSTVDRKELAALATVSEQILSRIINSRFKMTTPEFINSYRVREAAQLIQTGELSVKEIYFRVGFNSRSAFNSSFKKVTGKTPKEFRSGF